MSESVARSTTSTGVRVSLCETLKQIESMRIEIDALSCNPFLKCSWMIPWIKAFCPDTCRLQFLVVRDDRESLLGYAPLVLKSSLKRARYLAFVGGGKACADYMTFPARDGCEQIVIDAIGNWLAECSTTWDRIELDGVQASDPHMASFAEKMSSSEFDVTTVETLPSFRMAIPESWEQLLSGLSKNNRKKYRRMDRQLAGDSKLHIAKDSESLSEGLRTLEYLHTRRWNSLGEEGCFAHPGFREFLRGVAYEKLLEKKLSLVWMTWKGTAIAADIAWREAENLFTYQGGISPDHLELEPGKAILKCQIQLAMQQRLKHIDFLRGDEPYKSRFPTDKTENVRYEITGNSSRARISQTMLQLGRYMRTAIDDFQ